MWTKKSKSDSNGYPHKHRTELDGEGSGVTVHTSNGPVHSHDVEHYKVAPAKDGHTHDMQDGSSDIRGYTNSGEHAVYSEKEDKPGPERIKDQIEALSKLMADKSDQEIGKLASNDLQLQVTVGLSHGQFDPPVKKPVKPKLVGKKKGKK